VSTVTARVATRPAARPAPRPQPARAAPRRRQKAVQRSVRGGIVWIIALAMLLTGVVAINVAVLRQNMQLESYSTERGNLRDQNHELRSQLSRTSSYSYIKQHAKNRLGLVVAGPDDTTYIQLSAGGK
jgi:cell division protein FtsB